MKAINKTFILLLAALAPVSCDFLEPLPNGSYNEDNYEQYPTIIRGFIDKAYNLLPSNYYTTEYIGLDGASDNLVFVSPTNSTREFSTGSAKMSSNPFSSLWKRDYKAIYYANLFLQDDLGKNTHYLLDAESDAKLKETLQGDAFALRAWYTWDLLKTFGGEAEDGTMLGVPLQTEATPIEEMDASTLTRASYDETVLQILEDCDSAYAYLPYNNRDYPGDKIYVTPVVGSVRYKLFDQVAINCLRACVYLHWASPAFCTDAAKAQERYAKAAEYAAKAIRHKLDKESTLGFDPKVRFMWNDGNSPEIFVVSEVGRSASEVHYYPQNFGGSTALCPTQELVDAFPAANGYPISDQRSGYDPADPYSGRDPRFYSVIAYDGATVKRNVSPFETMYTFETHVGGKDESGLTDNGVSGYYFRKFIYTGWNPYDSQVQVGYKSIFFLRWEQMLLVFAEAANKLSGPQVKIDGISPKEAIGYLRSRKTIDNASGLGEVADPYLDECASSVEAFDALVRNEWTIVTCGEGFRYYNLRRWTADHENLSAINTTVHGVSITLGDDGVPSYAKTELETKKYPSLWNPLPYTEVRKCPGIKQNKGWESWK